MTTTSPSPEHMTLDTGWLHHTTQWGTTLAKDAAELGRKLSFPHQTLEQSSAGTAVWTLAVLAGREPTCDTLLELPRESWTPTEVLSDRSGTSGSDHSATRPSRAFSNSLSLSEAAGAQACHGSAFSDGGPCSFRQRLPNPSHPEP